MIRTYRALMVRLVEPFLGDSSRTVSADKVKSLLVSPETHQAFIVTMRDGEFAAQYVQAELAPGELQRALEICQCDVCGNVFENPQGLAGHRRIVHPQTQSAVGVSVKLGQKK